MAGDGRDGCVPAGSRCARRGGWVAWWLELVVGYTYSVDFHHAVIPPLQGLAVGSIGFIAVGAPSFGCAPTCSESTRLFDLAC